MAPQRPIPSFLLFQDKEGRWRWNFMAPNGRITAVGAETYLRQQGCIRAISGLREATAAPILVRQRVAPDAAASPQAAIPGNGEVGEGGVERDLLDLTKAQIV